MTFSIVISTLMLVSIIGATTSISATETIRSDHILTSSQDPGIGYESYQTAMILSPSDKLYSGTLHYSSSTIIQIVEFNGPLAEGGEEENVVWSSDGSTNYELVITDTPHQGMFEFTSNGIAIRANTDDPFLTSYTVIYDVVSVGEPIEVTPIQVAPIKVTPPIEEAVVEGSTVIVEEEIIMNGDTTGEETPPEEPTYSLPAGIVVDDADTKCREGKVLIFRTIHLDFICTDKTTAERWVELGMAIMQNVMIMEPVEPEMVPVEAEEETMVDEDTVVVEEDIIINGHTTADDMPMEDLGPGDLLRLYRANVPATIPLHHGYYNGESVYYIITDASESVHANTITEKQGWQVELAPLLANASDEALSTAYFFTNGVEGNGIHGFQDQVFTSTPAQSDTYSALTSHVHVTWNDDSASTLLDSADAIIQAEQDGLVTLTQLTAVINMPQIVWPEGQMMVKEDKTLTDDMPYGGGQVLDINLEEMTVTFIAHRGWGPDGHTIYYIVTDATPSGPAGMMGVTSTPTSASLIANSAAVDLYQFNSGIKGSGPMGFQAGIAAGAPDDENYSPMWRIFMIGWNDPSNASILETTGDINKAEQDGLININLARPMDSDHIVNCPFIDPFQ